MHPVLLPGLVWSPARVPASVVRAAGRLRAAVVSVADGTAWLPVAQAGGRAVPIDVAAASPSRYAAAVPSARALVPALRPGGVVLAADEARLRHLAVGGLVRFAGVTLRVVLVVPDAVLGDAEMFVTPADGVRLGLPPDRYLLVRPPTGSGWTADAVALRRAAPAGTRVRIVAPGRARALRQADAVLAPLEEKLRFGEFTALPQSSSGGSLSIDPQWLAAHLTTAAVPILGEVTCNRAFLPALRAALATVVAAGLQRLIHVADYGGCYNGRLIAGQPGSPISHHAYGSAIDLNVQANPLGSRPTQDARLVAIFARYGLTWGGSWLVPDGMHFEAL
ncbi:hypothetical protein acdb102_38710 [Acidothermaceae bacterium B102]|nr:hypothetical protein acdb102_38710 [Acidothermaceae bacterium B102]